LLNEHPHLRSAFFGPALFQTWQMERDAHAAVHIHGTTVPFIGREQLRDEVRAAIDDPAVRVIILSGPPSIGKTCLALEASSKPKPGSVPPCFRLGRWSAPRCARRD
jgi:hypothetical protein